MLTVQIVILILNRRRPQFRCILHERTTRKGSYEAVKVCSAWNWHTGVSRSLFKWCLISHEITFPPYQEERTRITIFLVQKSESARGIRSLNVFFSVSFILHPDPVYIVHLHSYRYVKLEAISRQLTNCVLHDVHTYAQWRARAAPREKTLILPVIVL